MRLLEEKIVETELILARLKHLKSSCTIKLETQNELLTFVYMAYQALGNSGDTVKVVVANKIRVKPSRSRCSSSHLFSYEDLQKIIDYQDIDDTLLQNAVRLQFNKNSRPKRIEDWNINGNYERAKIEAKMNGERLWPDEPTPLILIQED